ncbi:Uma2 family endonuclease [Hymenobacter taeanensis]|uniref:Uma2 family endonuclease n=1 Tax=Hymenobacter taeanensis TaxID=2735321 RepID=A0A6M6BGY7_9BACT|nr:MULTISPECIES: Uma2 family endonuclease [Hymenobacter]QJX47300.1 Uma2 family endonuclease [Hymenobacter taeanensis]UOQ79362.1 Uma2 family endonuclease [Hymenobacter sp. 5414T-23]
MLQPASATFRLYTVQEYQQLEVMSDVRHEFYRGEIQAMSGATADHNTIVLRTASRLLVGAESRGCRVFTESIQLEVAEGHYTYPDVMVTRHDEDVQAERTMKHPVLLIEVLSPSTAERDRVRKMFRYQRLPSLRHYLLISQQYQAVEWYHRPAEGAEWQRQLLTMPDEAVEIPKLAIKLPLADIYANLRIPLVTDNDAG